MSLVTSRSCRRVDEILTTRMIPSATAAMIEGVGNEEQRRRIDQDHVVEWSEFLENLAQPIRRQQLGRIRYVLAGRQQVEVVDERRLDEPIDRFAR